MNKYRFYHTDNLIIAVSTFAGKPVRGIAKCDPDDSFSMEYGKELAAARCNQKIAEKRMKRAKAKLNIACTALNNVEFQYDRMQDYYNDSIDHLVKAEQMVNEIIDRIQQN